MFDLVMAALEEIAVAVRGGDWGYGALAELLHSEGLARMIVNTIAPR